MSGNIRELFLYVAKTKVYLVVSDVLNTGEVNYYDFVYTVDCRDLSYEWVNLQIKKGISISSSEIQEHLGHDVLLRFGFTSFSDVYKKTRLMTLRIEEQKIKIFNAKKVKRWYEFEPIDPVEGYEIDEDGIKRLSEKLVKVLGAD